MGQELVLSKDLSLPLGTVTETFAIIANRGAGKSSTARVLAEEIHGAGQPVIVLDPKGDWYGIRSSSTGRRAGLPFVILGGDHGDIPLAPESGGLVAETLVAARASAILDLSALSKTRARRFAQDFAEALYKASREPVHVVIDEADVLVPQRASADTMRLLGAMEDLAKRGRHRGIGLTVASQRAQDVSKSVLDLMETLIVLRVTGPKSRKAVMDWMDDHTDDPEQMKTVLGSLKSLRTGQAWVYSPGWLRSPVQQVQVRRITTLDTHATPEPGAPRPAPAATAAVDLDALGAQMAALREQAQAEDPKALRAQVARLTRELEHAKDRVVEPTVIEVVPAAVLDAAGQVETAAAAVHATAATLLEQVEELDRARAALTAASASAGAGQPVASMRPSRTTQQQPAPVVARPAASVREAPAPRGQTNGHDPGLGEGLVLGKAHRAVLSVLNTYGPRDVDVVAVLAGYSAKGGGYRNALGALRTAGYIDGRGQIDLTDLGREVAGDTDPLPTGAALREHWKHQPALGKAHGLILDALAQAHPGDLSVDELAEATGYQAAGGGFRNALGRLRTLHLIYGRGRVALADELAGT